MKNQSALIIFLSFVLQITPQQSCNAEEFFLQSDPCNQPQRIILDVPCFHSLTPKLLDQPRSITLYTTSGIEVPALFFDRGSKTALIAGQGLLGSKEGMLIYAALFSDYDVILFDYRWNGQYGYFLLTSLLSCAPTQNILLDEEEEVRAVIDFLQQRNYEKIVGLGECYSNFLFAKIQATESQKSGKGPFSHLIFDSCWLSLKAFAESICRDPFLPLSPQSGGAPWPLAMITDCALIKWPILKIIFTFLHDISMTDYLPDLNCPVLFIHGLNDLFVPKHHFEALWQACSKGQRAALLTPYQHSDNLHNKALYHHVVNTFVKATSVTNFFDELLKNTGV